MTASNKLVTRKLFKKPGSGSQNSEKSRAAKIPTEASVCPTKTKNALAASIFFILL